MPKIIDGAQESILQSAKRILFEQGYTAFTIRAVATDCAMAVGTIYNYFPNKNVLIANIMAEDWFAALHTMDERIAAGTDLKTGLQVIYDEIAAFACIYESVWDQFNQSAAQPGITKDRHLLLRTQLEKRLALLICGTAFEQKDERLRLFAETVLAAALQKDISFATLADTAMCLFGNKK